MFCTAVLYFLILLVLPDAVELVCDGNNCKDCVKSSIKCRWCKRDGECHMPGAIFTNPCKRAENIVEESHCGNTLSRYKPELSMKMLLLSAAAYDPIDPQGCLNNSLSSAMFQLRIVVTRKCDSSGNKCSAYVAVSHSLKAIAVAFRGSLDSDQALEVFFSALTKPKESFLGGEVQSYWKKGFEELWTCLKEEVKALVTVYPSYQVWVTGHSLGGAMASMASAWLAYYHVGSPTNIILYTFGMPRVGNYDYALEHDKLVNNSWRVVNYDDPVPHFPILLSPNVVILNNPYHHGVEAYYEVRAASPYSQHKECHGKPYNEDASCSFTTVPSFLDLETHKVYFSIPVGTFWKTKCLRSRRKKRDTTENSNTTSPNSFQFKDDVCSKYKYTNHTYVQVAKPSRSTANPTYVQVAKPSRKTANPTYVQVVKPSRSTASKLIGTLHFFLLLIHIST
ncbi:lipase ZK262.3-like [Actinia tenebrosa]|uniref:Lipase ZK262.3-like n=1 Tax=Actinia tenebrosa TaxID=6105 RepID=A0A6P8I899_ACTTE|nr:lipase ZK262.3-like [Actinia tenebrosa]